ncbi:putative wall-associated receptor kinase-like 16 [Salvia miltiorrhiza]|uniref:putative wall-associated receptor kinase-like 16 n=1 Tax=Salvia miltiorrhiza TaxID=226208 RepID=UPI0025AC3863|nr:putative wall-associated receptor kinase-like 16 [Salvia miltiorrhiza]
MGMGMLLLLIPILAIHAHAFPVAKPGCADRCGNLTIPFPFGTSPGCYLNDDFFINCTQTQLPFLRASKIQITNISLTGGRLTVLQFIARDCYYPNGTLQDNDDPFITLSKFAVSNAANKFVVVGCDTTGYVEGRRLDGRNYRTGCTATCGGEDDVENGTCAGLGCCQTSIPKNVRRVSIKMGSTNNYTDVRFNKCGYSFVVEESSFAFSLQTLTSLRQVERLPMVVDWAIGNTSCAEAKANSSSYACKSVDSECYEADNGFGYRCNCASGFQGNPYLDVDGCRDIDECKDAGLNTCAELGYCVNTIGSFYCECPKGYNGDGRREEGCTPIQSKSESLLVRLVAGISLGVILLLLSACWFYFVLQNRRLIKMRQHYFHQNGGMLLQQKLHGRDRSQDLAKIYSEFELKRATKNFHNSMIIGEGGYGTVYKGFLAGDGVVAIKRAKQVPKQIDQFTNEVIVLSQIKHKNVVKLLGCCLETEFPLLVYEYISNGTLSQHVHNKARARLLSWETRLRLAAEVAGVLAYLHSEAASTPIIHRDVKCANILLDHSFTAKVSDFGASRLVPLDQSQLSTMVQGTFGYLDPEYMQTSQLNEKSDVYSFGVVLVEMLTGMAALSYDRVEEERNLANLFLMKQDCLFQILEENVVREGGEEEVMKVCVLARRCLNVRGEDRPSMKEVAMELEGVRGGGKKHAWIRAEYVEEDKERLLGEGFDGFINGGGNSSSVGFDSVRDEFILPVDGGR